MIAFSNLFCVLFLGSCICSVNGNEGETNWFSFSKLTEQQPETEASSEIKSPVASAQTRLFQRRRQRNKYQDQIYERDDSYSVPNESYEAPAPSYNAPSYEAPSYEAPSQSYGPPSYNSPSYYGGEDENDGFQNFLRALITFLPIGLFLAAIPPNITVVAANDNNNNNNGKRSADSTDEIVEKTYPFLSEISDMGINNFAFNLECQKRIFCYMAKMGEKSKRSNYVQKALFLVSQLSPLIENEEIRSTFESVKDDKCSEFKCYY